MTQYDLPPQAALQQSSARPLSGEELETYGKHAAAKYACGECCSLNAAVVETVKQAGLSPEQVKRVCEFANTDAFLKEFKKEAASSKYVMFESGPADFSEVLKDLNDGGGGSVFDRGNADYAHAPAVVKIGAARQQSMEKTASADQKSSRADEVLADAFAIDKTAEPLPYANSLQDVHELQDKLSTARDSATAELSALETIMLDATEDLYQRVKQAALEGMPLGHVVQAWDQALAPNPALVKAAFAQIGPRLQEEGVFNSLDALGQSLTKTAGLRAIVDETHPIVSAFGAYCEGTEKLAMLRAARQEFIDGINQLTLFGKSVNEHYPEQV
jgi:hypothetical protein